MTPGLGVRLPVAARPIRFRTQDLDAYFKKPAAIANYNYADVPDPCAGK